MLEYQSRHYAVCCGMYFQNCRVPFSSHSLSVSLALSFSRNCISSTHCFSIELICSAIVSSTYSHTCAINKIGIGAYNNRRTTSRAGMWLLFSSDKGIGLVQSGPTEYPKVPRQKVKVCITSKQNCCCVRVCLSMF